MRGAPGGLCRAVGGLSIHRKPLIFPEVFAPSTPAAEWTGPWDRAVSPASPYALTWDLGVSQVIKASSTEPLDNLLPCLGRQEFFWLCHSGVCKNACLKSFANSSLNSYGIDFPLPCSVPLPSARAEGERWEAESSAIPSPSLMEILGRDRTFLAKPLCINSQPRLLLLQGLAKGEAAEQRRNFSTHTTHKYLP